MKKQTIKETTVGEVWEIMVDALSTWVAVNAIILGVIVIVNAISSLMT